MRHKGGYLQSANPLTLKQIEGMSKKELYDITRKAAMAVERREKNLVKHDLTGWSYAHNYLINPETGKVNKIKYKGLSKKELMTQYNRAQYYMSYKTGFVTEAKKSKAREEKMLQKMAGTGKITNKEKKLYEKLKKNLIGKSSLASYMDSYKVVKVIYQTIRSRKSKESFATTLQRTMENLEAAHYAAPENQPLKSPLELVTQEGGWNNDPNTWFKDYP